MEENRMAFKEREKPFRLKVMESLVYRMSLSRDELRKYSNWVKGYDGELKFDGITGKLTCDAIILNDLLLMVNGKKFQIDAMVITAKGVRVYEVKNFEGEYFYHEGKMFHSKSNKEVFNPLNQISNASSLLRILMDQMGYHLPSKTYIVFINHNFSLFEAPRMEELLVPGRIESHFSKVNEISDGLTPTHRRFAEEIMSLHIEDFSLHNVPFYNETTIKKGVTCFHCGAFISDFTKNWSCVCKFCGKKERLSQTIVRHADEFIRLYPEQKITTPTISEFCGHELPEHRIRYALKHNYQMHGKKRWRYYD